MHRYWVKACSCEMQSLVTRAEKLKPRQQQQIEQAAFWFLKHLSPVEL